MKIRSLVFNNRLHLLDQVELQLWLLKMFTFNYRGAQLMVKFNLLTHLQPRTLELCNHRILLLHLKVVSKTKTEAPKSQRASTQNSKTKHLNLENEALENEAPIENEAPKTRNHCRLNNYNFTSSMTQSESGGGSGCVRTSKGRQNPSQGFIKACQLFN